MKLIYKYNTPILISHTLCAVFGKALLGQNAGALAFFPFIIVRNKYILEDQGFIRHELIHLRQYYETLVIGLWIIGFFQYMYARYILRKSKIQAYYFLSHEQEAHQYDQDPNYLQHRKWFSYYKYLLPKNKKRIDFTNGKRAISDSTIL